MSFQLLIVAFVLGFSGSFHCVGMCGPIAMAVPYAGQSDVSRWISIVQYLIGKAVTYTLLGVVFGFLGRQFINGGFQHVLSIVLGVLLLVVVVVMMFKNSLYHSNPIQEFVNKVIIKLFGNLLKKYNTATPFLLGALNGLLPCGLVYIGLLGATSAGSVLSGAAFMAAFGLGTMPLMFSFLALANKMSLWGRNKIKSITPVFIALAGVMLILRGLDVNIPFLSFMGNGSNHANAAIRCIP